MDDFKKHVIILKDAFTNKDSDSIENLFYEYFPKILNFLIEDSKNNFEKTGFCIHYDGNYIINCLHEAILIKDFNDKISNDKKNIQTIL